MLSVDSVEPLSQVNHCVLDSKHGMVRARSIEEATHPKAKPVTAGRGWEN